MAERTREWPLVLFTTALQCACGIALAAVLLAWRTPSAARPLIVAIFPIVGAGLLVSLFHLGRPLAAWRASTNVRRSRLSLEIVLAASFALISLANGTFTAAGAPSLPALLAGAIFGIAAVVCSARIYVLRSQPVWHSTWVPVTFVATAVVIAALAAHIVGEDGPVAALATVFAAALLIIADLLMLRRLVQVRRVLDNEPPGLPGPLLDHRQRACFVLHLLLTGIFPVMVVFGWSFGAPAAVALGAVAAGAACGRTLMYSLAAPHPGS